MVKRLFFLLALIFLIQSESYSQSTQAKLSGDLIIFHAGSLSVPIKEVAGEFNKLYPGVKILLESAEIKELLTHIRRIPLLRYEVLGLFQKFKLQYKDLVESAMKDTPGVTGK